MDCRVLEKLVFHGVCLHLLTSQVSKRKTKAMILMWTLYLKMAQDGHQNKSNTKKKSESESVKEWNHSPFFVGTYVWVRYVLGVVLCPFLYSQLLCFIVNFCVIFPMCGFSGSIFMCQGRTVDRIANHSFPCIIHCRAPSYPILTKSGILFLKWFKSWFC